MLTLWERNAVNDLTHALELGVNPRQFLSGAQFQFARIYVVSQLRRMWLAMLTAFPYTHRNAAGFAYRHQMSGNQLRNAFINWLLAEHFLAALIIMKASDGLTRLRLRFDAFRLMRDQYWDRRWNNMPWLEAQGSSDDEN